MIYYLTDKWLQLYHIFVCCLHVVCFLHYICNGPQFVMLLSAAVCVYTLKTVLSHFAKSLKSFFMPAFFMQVLRNKTFPDMLALIDIMITEHFRQMKMNLFGR